jgi:hypothetical protein
MIAVIASVATAVLICATAAFLVRWLVLEMWDADLDQLIAETADAINLDPKFRAWILADGKPVGVAHGLTITPDFDDDDGDTCASCGGEGIVNACWDDMCASMDECIHGDGMVRCDECHGAGFV